MVSASSTVTKRRNRSIVAVGGKTREMLSLSLLLRRFAYEVSMAETAAEAIERISSASPALVITDLVLPGIGGMDLFNLLKQTRRTASVPVVFLIPLCDTASENRCLGAGAAGCITKPVQAEDLYRTVQAAIEPIPRADFRIDARMPVSVDNLPLGCPEGECEVDLSVHGMYVPMQKPYPRNRRITVQFNIKDRMISAQGAVLYSNASGAGSYRGPGIGLKFIDLAAQDQEFIRTFIRDEVSRDITAVLSREFTDTL
jgi:CheY-like chemotaxis protein